MMKTVVLLAILALADSLAPLRALSRVQGRHVMMSDGGKGFGKSPPPPKPKATTPPPPSPGASAESSSPLSDKPEYPDISPSAAKVTGLSPR